MERLSCRYSGCVEFREGFPGSDVYCAFHNREQHNASLRSRPPERPVILWCPKHETITTPIQPYEVWTARDRHTKAGCHGRLKTFVLDPAR